MSTSNTHTGRGPQNNNNAAYQNVIYGGGQLGQMVVGGVNSNFVNNFNTTVSEPHRFRSLWDAIAGVGASHKAEHQFARGACLEGTREAVLAILREWGLAEGQRHPICWLSGAAGVGKSSIALTIARFYQNKNMLASSFFFFPSDPKRNNPSALVLTIAHGLVTMIPLMRNYIEERISRDPTILEDTLEEQFQALVVEPALKWSRQRAIWGSPVGPHVVILDGLDECGDEETQLRILALIQSAYAQTPRFPLQFLICSRPEAWIREAFGDEGLRKLSKTIVLNETFEPNRDIMRYYLHHFQKIASSPKYNQVPFPSSWPSQRELEILVERSCGQFIYAATVIRFIMLAYNHPIEQLLIIINKIPPRRPGTSPYHQLDVLYDFILSVNPDREGLLPILATVLILRSYMMLSPARIEFLLRLPGGQVALTLRSMHSVLDIHGREDQIRIYHRSFDDYLVDQTRSLDFYIDVSEWRHAIAQQWLQNLSANRIRTYSSSQLYGDEIKHFFLKWMEFCPSIREPSWELLEDMQKINVASVRMLSTTGRWEVMFGNLIPWLQISPVSGYGSEVRKRLIQTFRRSPKCFHLEWPWDELTPANVTFWVVEIASNCVYPTSLGRIQPSDLPRMPLLMDCHCELSGGNNPSDSRHLAYQGACMQLVRGYILLYEELVQSGGAEDEKPLDLEHVFRNLIHSSLLKHCRLDAELLSHCRMFFGLVQRRLNMAVNFADAMRGRKNLVRWIETFPDRFAGEGEDLKAQLFAWPLERWHQNWFAL
ncbi:hypothetical protein PM082_000655 [Marasmius tenuissimus]|nr:hypothetical protein PM082_000655 [Marasmius tenuissimus]